MGWAPSKTGVTQGALTTIGYQEELSRLYYVV